MEARYVFTVRFRLDHERGLQLDPATFETTLRWTAAEPGTDGWLRFRDLLWRGEINNKPYVRDLFSAALSASVEAVEFRALETDEAYLEALKREIADDLDAFNAASVSEVLNKYLASRLEVR